MHTTTKHFAARIHLLGLLAALAFQAGAFAQQAQAQATAPLAIQAQGSFAVGGTVTQGVHGDHAYVFYQVPVHARPLPLVMLHGAGQSSKTWESTPDGREGFQTIFLRRGFPVYLMDQPRRGKAGRSSVALNLTPTPDEPFWFNQFRLGVWPSLFTGVQFSRDPEALNQYFRQMTPNTGPYDSEVISDATAALFNKIGPGVLITHSQAGGPGWMTAMKTAQVRAIISYEPGSGYVFPKEELPAPLQSAGGALEGVGVPLDDFMKLTRIPIVVYYGDNIPDKPMAAPGQDSWRIRLEMARLWRDTVNRHGGDVTLVHLPELGIRGNTHFAFSDINNAEIADLLSKFLQSKHLD